MNKLENGILIKMTASEEAEYAAYQQSLSGMSPAPMPPQLYAIAQITTDNGEISELRISSRLSAAIRWDVGKYMLFFTEPMSDTGYLSLAYDGGAYRCFVSSDEKTEDYLIVSVVDLSGNPADPPSFSLEIKRVN